MSIPVLAQVMLIMGASIYLAACLLGYHKAPRSFLPKTDATALHATAARQMIKHGRQVSADEVWGQVDSLEPIVPHRYRDPSYLDAPRRHRKN